MTIEIRRSQTFGAVTLADAGRVAFAAAKAIVVNHARRREVMRVSEMPDYLLKDIGLKRDDIYDAMRADWREDPTFRLAVAAARRRREGRD